jgi:hypothetical protein
MPFNLFYVTGQYNAAVLFENGEDASNWFQQTTELKGLMRHYAEDNAERRWTRSRAGDFLMRWLEQFLAYQEEWGSQMVAPDVLAAAFDNNINGLPANGRDPITIPTAVQGTVAGCTMIQLPRDPDTEDN